MHTNEVTELKNLCMIYDDQGRVLLQNRRKKFWPGVTFPGGHVEPGESLVCSVIREIREETGLDIRDVQLCGVKEWFEDGVRSMVFFYKTNQFSGQLHSSEEGEVFWAPLDGLSGYKLASNFDRNLKMFLSDSISELFYRPGEDEILLEY